MSRAASSLLKKLRGVSPLAKVKEAAKGYPGAQEGARRLSAVSVDKNKKSNQAEDATLSYVSDIIFIFYRVHSSFVSLGFLRKCKPQRQFYTLDNPACSIW